MQTSTVIKIMRDRCPYELHQRLQQSIYINDRRPNYGKFQDNSKGKVGKHRIENRLSWMANIPWRREIWTNDGLRIFLKESLNISFKEA